MTPEEQRRELLRNFDRAEQALRANLRLLGGVHQARAHTERALGPHPGGLYRDQRKRQGQDCEAVGRRP